MCGFMRVGRIIRLIACQLLEAEMYGNLMIPFRDLLLHWLSIDSYSS